MLIAHGDTDPQTSSLFALMALTAANSNHSAADKALIADPAQSLAESADDALLCLEACLQGARIAPSASQPAPQPAPAADLQQFEVGATYFARSICDHDCIYRRTVVRRTARFLWLRDESGHVERRGVRVWGGVETCLFDGSYSMAPSLSADRRAR